MSRRGFTLIELLIATLILVSFAALITQGLRRLRIVTQVRSGVSQVAALMYRVRAQVRELGVPYKLEIVASTPPVMRGFRWALGSDRAKSSMVVDREIDLPECFTAGVRFGGADPFKAVVNIGGPIKDLVVKLPVSAFRVQELWEVSLTTGGDVQMVRKDGAM